ncbi:MAG: N-acetyltransferase [Gemmatimonadetes bacterium]|nr:N-acetyltransferase [Gemmatimonadota bacterium]
MPSNTTQTTIRVVPYVPGDPTHRSAFRALNMAWIEEYFAVEGRDRIELDDPERHILATGGHIFVAEDGTTVLGVVALIPEHDGAWELVKMAVAREARGRGVGRALGEAMIAKARSLGASRVELLSNTVLTPAISLYRALGFVQVPLPATDYARANIKMVLTL